MPSAIAFWLIALVVLPPAWFGATQALPDSLGVPSVMIFAGLAIVSNCAAVFVPRFRRGLALLSATTLFSLTIVLFAAHIPVAAGLAFFAAMRMVLVYWTGAVEREAWLPDQCATCPDRLERMPAPSSPPPSIPPPSRWR